nr:single-stranded DNA-binding protein 4 [Pelodiscus sinensis]|eukprot:XP_014433660.1 single-stranded DNA-binding protein 4 [Pelodiscus sinensis]
MKFCAGSCPHNHKPASMHAQIKARLHTLSKEMPSPCCVPAGYDPMVLMHYSSDGRIVSTLFEDMIVTRCHCSPDPQGTPVGSGVLWGVEHCRGLCPQALSDAAAFPTGAPCPDPAQVACPSLLQIRWEKNITLGEPPGFLHSWWCVFWDLYCAAPDRRETCEHSSEAKAFHDYSAAAAPSPVMGNMPPNDGMPGGTMPPGFFQVSRPAARLAGSPSLRMASFGGQSAAAAPSPVMGNMPPNDGMPGGTMPPGFFQGPPGSGGPPGTPIMPSPGDSTNSSENMYTILSPALWGGQLGAL